MNIEEELIDIEQYQRIINHTVQPNSTQKLDYLQYGVLCKILLDLHEIDLAQKYSIELSNKNIEYSKKQILQVKYFPKEQIAKRWISTKKQSGLSLFRNIYKSTLVRLLYTTRYTSVISFLIDETKSQYDKYGYDDQNAFNIFSKTTEHKKDIITKKLLIIYESVGDWIDQKQSKAIWKNVIDDVFFNYEQNMFSENGGKKLYRKYKFKISYVSSRELIAACMHEVPPTDVIIRDKRGMEISEAFDATHSEQETILNDCLGNMKDNKDPTQNNNESDGSQEDSLDSDEEEMDVWYPWEFTLDELKKDILEDEEIEHMFDESKKQIEMKKPINLPNYKEKQNSKSKKCKQDKKQYYSIEWDAVIMDFSDSFNTNACKFDKDVNESECLWLACSLLYCKLYYGKRCILFETYEEKELSDLYSEALRSRGR